MSENSASRRKDTGRPGNGGKYDHTPGSRSDAPLDPSREDGAGEHERHWDGSALYPPVLESADDAFEFWSGVELPDSLLMRVDGAVREATEEGWREHWHATWKRDDWAGGIADLLHPVTEDMTSEQRAAAEAARVRAAKDANAWFERENAEPWYDNLEPRDIRPIARSLAMYREAINLDSETETARLLAREVTFGGREVAVWQAVAWSSVALAGDRIFDPVSAADDAPASQRQIVGLGDILDEKINHLAVLTSPEMAKEFEERGMIDLGPRRRGLFKRG